MEERINTARLSAMTGIDTLSSEQLAAVRLLRRFAESQAVSPYTVGILCQRDLLLLNRLSDGRRYARLSPASRELLIAEVREMLYPSEPSVVAVWSAWARQNDISVDEHEDPEPAEEAREPETPVLLGLESPLDRLRAIAQRMGCGTASLSRWAEMVPNQYGNPYGARTLPDRESDEGIELAEEVFQACYPLSPDSVSHQAYRKPGRV